MLQCEKLLWLDKYLPEKAEYSAATLRRFAAGNKIGELAKGLFGAYSDMTAHKIGGGLDIRQMKENTRAAIARGDEVICEAALDADGLYCAVDILKKTDGGYALYEVKGSVHVKAAYIADAAYQLHVLKLAGLNITGCYIVTINGEYERQGGLDIRSMFTINDISDKVGVYAYPLTQNINRARDVLSKKDEPAIAYGKQCRQPYECPFIAYCRSKLTEPSAFDLYGGEKKADWSDKGYRTMRDVLGAGEELSPLQRRQIEYAYADDLPIYVDKINLAGFLSKISYPLYFLDFEAAMPDIPAFDGARPFMNLPFMFSLHYIEEAGGELKHYEALSENIDPRRDIADALARVVGDDGCIIAYNASFEKRVIAGLAEQFPEYRDKFDRINQNFIDLLDVFKGGMVYNKEMGGSFSLKSVLPALFPGDASLDYDALENVGDGSEAMALYAELAPATDERKDEIKSSLSRYCALDTLALYKITEKLYELIK